MLLTAGWSALLLIAIGLAAQTPTPPAVSTVTYNSLDLTKLNGDSAQTVHVRHPLAATTIVPLVQLREGAAATSAGYYASRRHQGRRVMPIIHPHSRIACDVTRSVTVLAQDCMCADALTKVVHADAEKAGAVLARFNARAFIVENDPLTGGARVLDTAATGQPHWHARWGVAARHV